MTNGRSKPPALRLGSARARRAHADRIRPGYLGRRTRASGRLRHSIFSERMNAPLAGLPEIDVSSCTSLPPASGSPVTGTVFSVSKSVNDQFSPLEAGDVPLIPLGGTVEWYQYEGSYVVQYPLSLSTAGPLCLGNSIAVGSEFLHVSDSPPEVGACDVPAILDNPDVLATPPQVLTPAARISTTLRRFPPRQRGSCTHPAVGS